MLDFLSSRRFPRATEWGVLVAVLFLAHVVFLYSDLTNTIDNANIFLESVFEGRPLEFYELSVQRASTYWPANYNLAVYVVFGIWQLPFWIASRLLGITYLSWVPAMLWSKTLVLLFSVGVAWMAGRVAKLASSEPDASGLVAFLCLSSVAAFYSVGVCGQLESISTFAMLCGVHAYLRGDMRRFWLAFVLAAPLKMFSLLLALPLVLLREKRIPRALVMWASMAVLLVLEGVVFGGSATREYALAAQSRDAIQKVLTTQVELGRPVVPFVACYCGIVLYAYLKRDASPAETAHLGLAVWGSFVALSSLNSYWVYLYVPFFAICVCTGTKLRKTVVIAETVGASSFLLWACATGAMPLQDGDLLSRLALRGSGILPDPGTLRYEGAKGLFEQLNIARFAPAFSTVFAFAILAVVVLTLPQLQARIREEGDEEVTRALLIVRPFVIAVAALLCAWPHLASANPALVDTTSRQTVGCSENLTAGDGAPVVEQALGLSEGRRLDELVLRFENGSFSRSNLALLRVELAKAESGETVFSKEVGCSFIDTDVDAKVALKGTWVDPGEYVIRLSGSPDCAMKRDACTLVPRLVSNEGLDVPRARVGNRELAGCLYVRLR